MESNENVGMSYCTYKPMLKKCRLRKAVRGSVALSESLMRPNKNLRTDFEISES